MDRIELIGQVRELTVRTEQVLTEKASSLEQEQVAKSEFYHWCREQMMAIHQLKYQFSKEVALIHRETVRLNQDLRCKLKRLREGLPLFPEVESPDVDNRQSPCCASLDPENPKT